MDQVDSNELSCAEVLELVYMSRLRVVEEISVLRRMALEGARSWRAAVGSASRVSSFLSAQTHFVGGLAAQRSMCFSEELLVQLTAGVGRLRHVTERYFEILWAAAEQDHENEILELEEALLREVVTVLEDDLVMLQSVVKGWHSAAEPRGARPSFGEPRTLETLRHDAFEDHALDVGLMQGLLRMWPPGVSVGDLSRATGLSSRLNDTGLVQSHAFRTGDWDLGQLHEPLQWRSFDWIVSLDVAESVPDWASVQFLRNLVVHAERGVVLSWGQPGIATMGMANTKTEEEVLRLMRKHISEFHFDEDLTGDLRHRSSDPRHANALYVFTRKGPRLSLHNACLIEQGVIYAGDDVSVLNTVASSEDCCKLCHAQAGCSYFVWAAQGEYDHVCWLKSSKLHSLGHDHYMSGTLAA